MATLSRLPSLLLLFLSILQHLRCANMRHYYFDVTERTWAEAKTYCDIYHHGLATIITQNDLNSAKSQIPLLVGHLITQIWIGLNDQNIEGVWEWADTTKCQYDSTTGHDCSDFWLINEPNDYGDVHQNCGRMWFYNGVWQFDDIRCDYKMPTLCNTYVEKKYVWNDILRNWTDAERFCNKNHGGLATIQTSNEYIAAINAIPSELVQKVWIGLNDRETEGVWEWSDGEKCINYDDSNTSIGHDCTPYWREGEPNNGHNLENCGDFKFYDEEIWEINDDECYNLHSVLCTQSVTGYPTPYPSPPPPDSHFVYVPISTSWAEALIYCEKNYIGLATITSIDELNEIITLIPSNNVVNVDDVWIGINDIKNEGVWQWSDDTQCTLNNDKCSDFWHDGQPDDHTGEDCGQLWYHNDVWGFNDAPCDMPLPAICTKVYVSNGPTRSPTLNPTKISKSPTSKTSPPPTEKNVILTPTIHPSEQLLTTNIGQNSSSQSSSSSVSVLDIMLIIIIILLVIVLSVTMFYLLKYKKIIGSNAHKFKQFKDVGDEEQTNSKDIQLVTSDQM